MLIHFTELDSWILPYRNLGKKSGSSFSSSGFKNFILMKFLIKDEHFDKIIRNLHNTIRQHL